MQLEERQQPFLKLLPKNEKKKKSVKYNYEVAQRVYSFIYTNIAEQFKIYVNSIMPNEIGEIKNDFQANGNDLLSAADTESATKLFHSFAVFYYINGRSPYTDGHLFVPDGEISQEFRVENYV